MESRHAEVMSSLNEVRASQKLLEDRVTDVTERLATVENKVSTLERLTDDADTRRTVAEIVNCENSAVLSRLDDLEDRARRDNLIFHGIDDSHSDTWASAEEKVRELLTTTFSEQVPADGISRAHRLGSFVEKKCRPIIVKFASAKTKDRILSQRAKLKGTCITIQEDFCKATRYSRKKLHDFGKATGKQYSLRYNKLYVGKQCYTYCSVTDSVYEIGTYSAPLSTDDTAGISPANSPLPHPTAT
ncbi:uncharacterized protein LOC144144851 [Haemaphysalis longicornis]